MGLYILSAGVGKVILFFVPIKLNNFGRTNAMRTTELQLASNFVRPDKRFTTFALFVGFFTYNVFVYT